MSIDELAQQAGVSYHTIQAIESGTAPKRMAVVRKLCRALRVAPFVVDEFRTLVGDGSAAVAYVIEHDSERILAASRDADAGQWLLAEESEAFMEGPEFTSEEWRDAVHAAKVQDRSH